MQDIRTAPFLQEFCRLTDTMYRLGWDERNGGNISIMLDEEKVTPYLDTTRVLRRLPLSFDARMLAGRLFLVTGTGKYFRNVSLEPDTHLGLFRIAPEGDGIDLLWGYADGGAPTSELPTHLMSHIARLAVDPTHRVIVHSHAPNIIAMTFVHPLDDRALTRSLWRMITECMVVFPDGVGVLPWMLCGGDEIGEATAEKMHDTRLVIWAHHGLLGAGANFDEAFGLVETVEKAAQIYMAIAHWPRLAEIQDDELRVLAKAFRVTPRAGFLD